MLAGRQQQNSGRRHDTRLQASPVAARRWHMHPRAPYSSHEGGSSLSSLKGALSPLLTLQTLEWHAAAVMPSMAQRARGAPATTGSVNMPAIHAWMGERNLHDWAISPCFMPDQSLHVAGRTRPVDGGSIRSRASAPFPLKWPPHACAGAGSSLRPLHRFTLRLLVRVGFRIWDLWGYGFTLKRPCPLWYSRANPQTPAKHARHACMHGTKLNTAASPSFGCR